jgi:hypothetical protein
MKNKLEHTIHLSLIIFGGLIMFLVAIIAIIDSYAVDMISSIPVSIFGAALFVSGYISYFKNK